MFRDVLVDVWPPSARVLRAQTVRRSALGGFFDRFQHFHVFFKILLFSCDTVCLPPAFWEGDYLFGGVPSDISSRFAIICLFLMILLLLYVCKFLCLAVLFLPARAQRALPFFKNPGDSFCSVSVSKHFVFVACISATSLMLLVNIRRFYMVKSAYTSPVSCTSVYPRGNDFLKNLFFVRTTRTLFVVHWSVLVLKNQNPYFVV
jgi:hypothetical protein